MASLSDIVFFLAFLQVAYLVSLFIARLYFSPIARFPGPRLAAVSYFYEFYYDFICRGQYEFKIEYLHEKYGPVIRINPGELHVSDPDFYSQVFVSSSVRKSSRPVSHRNAAPSRESTNTTLDHDHHHRRRKALDPYFSRAMVTKLEPEIQTLVQRMHERLWTFRGSGKPVNLFEVFSALAADVITGYCFGTRWDSLEKEDFNADIAHVHNSYTKLMPLFRLFPTLLDLSLGIPEWMITDPGVAEMQKHKHRIEKQVQDTRTSTTTAQKPVKATENGDRFHHSTIFDELLERSSLPPSELTDQRLTDEAITLVGAGLVTTAHTLAFISFYLLNQPGTLAKLRLALEPLMARYPAVKPSWTQLEAVPYLNAVVTETLRMHGVLRRNARIFPEDDVRCGEWTIPAGTAISMSASTLHNYSSVFPDPFSFIPDRWLEGDVALKRKYWVAFGKGTRACMGIHLANAEIYHATAALFRPNGLRFDLFETDETDVRYKHDFLFPSPKEDTKGVRVLIS